MVEAVAGLAVRSRLKSFDSVDTNIDCDTQSLMQGKVQGVRVAGQSWCSQLGLTAHLFDINLCESGVDYAAMFMQRKVILTNQPTGWARVLFDAEDFDNFLAHPLVVEAASTAVRGQTFTFERGSAVLHTCGEAADQTVESNQVAGAETHIRFRGSWQDDTYEIILTPDRSRKLQETFSKVVSSRTSSADSASSATAGYNSRVCVRASLVHASQNSNYADYGNHGSAHDITIFQGNFDNSMMIAGCMQAFFNRLQLDLQGAELKFAGMSFHAPGDSFSTGTHTASSDRVLVDLQLSLRLRSFPPLDVQF